MTNYSERLDELMPCDCKFLKGFAWREGDPCEGCINGRLKQAITSLIKELVAEAKPEYNSKLSRSYFQANPDHLKAHKNGYRLGVREFEQNLLKALEE